MLPAFLRFVFANRKIKNNAGIVFETVQVEYSPGGLFHIDCLVETVLDMCSRLK